MPWFEASSIVLILLLLVWGFSLSRENAKIKKENLRLLKKSGEYAQIQNDAKLLLQDTPEIKTIKLLRVKYGLSLVDAKNVVDSAK